MSEAAFRALAAPLISALEHSDLGTEILLVPTHELISPESLIARTSINRMAGFTTMPPRDIASFLPQDGFEPPEGPFYLVVDPHTGTAYVNREPDVARKLIDSDERLPLTLEEGLAIATQHPDWLVRKNGFNLLGSRSADGRVPSIWMSQNSPVWARYGPIRGIPGSATPTAWRVVAFRSLLEARCSPPCSGGRLRLFD